MKCWGEGGNGELGGGVFATSYNPVDVISLTTVTQITAGSLHTCAVKADNTMWCWGYNNNGQLGTGDTTARHTPTQVTSITGVAKGVAGASTYYSSGWYYYDHTCAIKTNGTLWCWGYGLNYQLGQGSATSSYAPVQVLDTDGVTPMTGVLDADVGVFATCAVVTGGFVKCVGHNAHGWLGDGTVTQRTAPVLVHGVGNVGTLSGVTAIRLNYSHYEGSTWGGMGAALLNDGRIVTWGWNANGTLGDNYGGTRYYPGFVYW